MWICRRYHNGCRHFIFRVRPQCYGADFYVWNNNRYRTQAVKPNAVKLLTNQLRILKNTFSVLGFGLGLHYYVASTIINEYFFENRVFAEGMVGGGIGLGTFLFSLLQQFLTNQHTWQVGYNIFSILSK